MQNNSGIEIRRERIVHDVRQQITVLYLSDFHFTGRSLDTAKTILDGVRKLNPDIILLGGDYADTKRGFECFRKFVGGLTGRKNVFAIAGNHDSFSGTEKYRLLFEEHGITWIEKRSADVHVKMCFIRIDGNAFGTESKADFRILCLHKPVDLPAMHNYNLILAGHLHGSQVVLWQKGNSLYPGKLFYKWNILKNESRKYSYIISKGLGDTIPFRYNCSKDMLFVTIENPNFNLQ